MITRIELTNFMSHRRTVIEPAAGLTVLVGPNNCGKSAVVAALQILCRNENSTYVLRHGEKECGITLQTADGHVIEWRRKNSPSYRINGQAFDRLGRNGVPDELHQALKLPLVDSGGDADFDVHFGAQKSPIFLLASSAQNAARFFASSSDAIRLVSMQKRHKEKVTDAQKEKNRLEATSKKLTAELDTLAPVVDLDERLTSAEQLFGEVALCQAALDDAQKLARLWTDQLAVLERQTRVANALSDLPSPPALAPVEALASLIASLEVQEQKRRSASARIRVLGPLSAPPLLADVSSFERRVAELGTQQIVAANWQSECTRLKPLAPPPSMADVETLTILLGTIESAQRRASQATRLTTALAQVTCPPELADEAELQRLVETLGKQSMKVHAAQRRGAALASFTQPPAVGDTAALAQFVEKLTVAAEQTAGLTNLIQHEDAALAAAATDLRMAAEGAVCPTCGGPIDSERLLARSAAGQGGNADG
jgi:exonuclease SbcC